MRQFNLKLTILDYTKTTMECVGVKETSRKFCLSGFLSLLRVAGFINTGRLFICIFGNDVKLARL